MSSNLKLNLMGTARNIRDEINFHDEIRVYRDEGVEEEEHGHSSENLNEDKAKLVNEGEIMNLQNGANITTQQQHSHTHTNIHSHSNSRNGISMPPHPAKHSLSLIDYCKEYLAQHQSLHSQLFSTVQTHPSSSISSLSSSIPLANCISSSAVSSTAKYMPAPLLMPSLPPPTLPQPPLFPSVISPPSHSSVFPGPPPPQLCPPLPHPAAALPHSFSVSSLHHEAVAPTLPHHHQHHSHHHLQQHHHHHPVQSTFSAPSSSSLFPLPPIVPLVAHEGDTRCYDKYEEQDWKKIAVASAESQAIFKDF